MPSLRWSMELELLGVEIRKDFAQLALHNLVKVGVRSRGEIICGDFMCIDLAKHLL